MLPRLRRPAPTLCGRGHDTEVSTSGNMRREEEGASFEAVGSLDVEATGDPLTLGPAPLTAGLDLVACGCARCAEERRGGVYQLTQSSSEDAEHSRAP